MATFGQNLTVLQTARQMSVKTLAELVGVKPSVVSGWRKDKRGTPKALTLLKLAKALDCSVEDLLVGVDFDYDILVMRRRGWSLMFAMTATSAMSDAAAAVDEPGLAKLHAKLRDFAKRNPSIVSTDVETTAENVESIIADDQYGDGIVKELAELARDIQNTFDKGNRPVVEGPSDWPATLRSRPVKVSGSTQTAGGIADQLAKLAQLNDQGALTDEEFATAKQRVLGGS